MFLKYFINPTKHKQKLNKYTEEVGEKFAAFKKAYPGRIICGDTKGLLLNANSNHSLFYTGINTSTSKKISSYIPFTAAFKTRVSCARSIDRAYKELRFVANAIKGLQAEMAPEQTIPPAASSATRKRSQSEPLPVNHKSPITAISRKTVKDDSYLPPEHYYQPRRNLIC